MQTKYGGFWIRFLASIIDGLILSVINGIISIPFLIIFGISLPAFDEISDSKFVVLQETNNDFLIITLVLSYIGLIIFSVIINWLYSALMESSKKQATLGKAAVGLKVVDSNYERISFGRATARYFSKFLSSLFLMLGYIMAGFSAKKMALHDHIAGTYVIHSN